MRVGHHSAAKSRSLAKVTVAPAEHSKGLTAT